MHAEKAINWFIKSYNSIIKDCFYIKRCFRNDYKAELDDVFFFLHEDLIVNFDVNQSTARLLYRNTCVEEIETIVKAIRKFTKRKDRVIPEINLLVNTSTGINIQSLKISRPRLNIMDNYNDDFFEVHQTILKRLSRKNDKGIILLHGKPGTGKTSYIRYLIASIKKEIIFLPPNMASAITNPDLLAILVRNPNSVFVIEDSESIVIDRERQNASPVSALLNLADGLLADCLNIQIICSFNTDLSKVDSALMRKGRLIAKYEFKELDTEKAKRLSKKLGFDTNICRPMTLADIYNQNEKEFSQVKKIFHWLSILISTKIIMPSLNIPNSENPLWQNKSFLEAFEQSKGFILTAEEEATLIENSKSDNPRKSIGTSIRLCMGTLNIILKTITMFTDDENLLQPLVGVAFNAAGKTLLAEMENKPGQIIYSRLMALNIEQSISDYLNENESK